MKYKVLYDTHIAGKFLAKDEILDFKNGTDENFINRLVANKIIEKLPAQKAPQNDEKNEAIEKKAKKAND